MLERAGSVRAALLLVTLATVAPTTQAEAQQLSIEIKDGLVTLSAENVTLRTILDEWRRVSGALIVNGDKLDNKQPLVLRLEDLTERAALATLLRGVGSYALGQRAGSTAIDRILILSDGLPRTVPASTGVQAVATAPAASEPLSDDLLRNPGFFAAHEAAAAVQLNRDASKLVPNENLIVDRVGGVVTGAGLVVGTNDQGRPVRGPTIVPQPEPPAPAAPAIPPNPFGITGGTAQPGVITPPPPVR